MSRHNIQFEMESANMTDGAILRNAAGHVIFQFGAVTPADGANGYSKGCLVINTTTGALAKNNGTATSAVWQNGSFS